MCVCLCKCVCMCVFLPPHQPSQKLTADWTTAAGPVLGGSSESGGTISGSSMDVEDDV